MTAIDDHTEAQLLTWFENDLLAGKLSLGYDVATFEGYSGSNFTMEVLLLGQALYYSPLPLARELNIDPITDSDGVITGFELSLIIAPYEVLDGTFYLGRYMEWEATTRNESTAGAEGAWHTLLAMADNWIALVGATEKVRRGLGLVSDQV